MFDNLKLTPKIAGSIAITLLITSGIGFFVTQNRINTQAQDAFIDKLRKTDGMAGAVRTYFSANVDVYVPNREFKQVKQVPVVVAWNVARDYAESQGMKFSTPSLHPRNPQHAPDDFEREALTRFESSPDLKEYFKRTMVDGQEVMRYAQPVRLTADCLICHGDPAGAKDPFGYAKEGMKVGDLRGAFVVTAPLAAVREAAWGNSLALLLLSVVAMFSVVAVVFFLVQRFVVAPVAEAAALANHIANNNLAVADIRIRAHDEIGDAGAALNKMKNNLHEVIQSIAGSAQHVSSASAELNTTSQQISANSEETSAQAEVVSKAALAVSQNLQTVATGAEEMGASIKEIAKNATEAAKVATSAVKVADSANTAVSKLGDSSAEIGQVIKVITSIAQQTNLLALNATIEAARAGEAGKGFAVVANEVKELAKETARATEDISRKIEAIQSDTKAAVDAIASISSVIDQINNISGTIATAVEEQSATTKEMSRNVSEAAQGSGEITSNIAGVAQAAQGTSRGSADTQKAAHELVQMSSQLRRLVEQFKLSASDNENDNESGAPSPEPVQSKAAHAGS
jgi:methyl-accepting chemotaxis protein